MYFYTTQRCMVRYIFVFHKAIKPDLAKMLMLAIRLQLNKFGKFMTPNCLRILFSILNLSFAKVYECMHVK